MNLASGSDVPNPRSEISTGGRQHFLIRTEDGDVDRVRVSCEGALHGPVGGVDQSDLAVTCGYDERLAVSAERKTIDTRFRIRWQRRRRLTRRKSLRACRRNAEQDQRSETEFGHSYTHERLRLRSRCQSSNDTVDFNSGTRSQSV